MTLATSFSQNLRNICEDSAYNYNLLIAVADEIGGHPNYVPQWFAVNYHPAYWVGHLLSRYWNMADGEGWQPLRSYELRDSQSTSRLMHEYRDSKR